MVKKTEASVVSSLLSAPFQVVKYVVKNPVNSTLYYLSAFALAGAEALKIKEVSYATYPLIGNIGRGLLPSASGAMHAGLHFKLEDDSYRELHYDGKISETNNHEYDDRKRLGLYHIDNLNADYHDIKKMINEEFKGVYALGKRDCWAMVEWFAEEKLHKDKKDLKGPIGNRDGFGNGVRHVFHQGGEAINHATGSLEGFGKDVARETTKFLRNPGKAVLEGMKNPEKLAKNIQSAACKFVGEDFVRKLGVKC